MPSHPNIYTIPLDLPFLPTLATAILKGFPCDSGERFRPDPLYRWTILLPTRRACVELEGCLFYLSGSTSLILPRIRALGDVDEDFTGSPQSGLSLPQPIDPIVRDFILMGLIDEWSKSNPQTILSRRLAASPPQAHALAISLGQLIDEFETEETVLSNFPELFGAEIAIHREAILDLLSIVRTQYPEYLRRTGQIGERERRSLLLKHEARMLIESPPPGPVIAAGSTGSIPATRTLLKAVASLPMGAVVLPGLDLQLDNVSWDAVGSQHPQFFLKKLLHAMGSSRDCIRLLEGTEHGSRSWLAREIMRPTETTEDWFAAVGAGGNTLCDAMDGIELVELPTRQDESAAIAIMIRKLTENPATRVSFVTPDRTLARRVKSELRRWDNAVSDSAGKPLIGFPGPSLVSLLSDVAISNFSPASLSSLFHHDLCRFGIAPELARRAVNVLDLAIFIQGKPIMEIGSLVQLLDSVAKSSAADPHGHPALKRIDEEQWKLARLFAERAQVALLKIAPELVGPIAVHFNTIVTIAEEIAGSDLWSGEAGIEFERFRDRLLKRTKISQAASMAVVARIVQHHLKSSKLFQLSGRGEAISILGLLEARLLSSDVVILGGLHEGTWPSQSDTGPWLSRPMRETLSLQQPEGDIGRMAHDFVQCFSCPKIYFVWSRRDADEPKLPSRWILRLQILLNAAGMANRTGGDTEWRQFVSLLKSTPILKSLQKPKPRPPALARPKKLSITHVETLLRDPYAYYARAILKLHPLVQATAFLNMAKRGTLIHSAIAAFLHKYPHKLPDNTLEALIIFGKEKFANLLDEPEIAGFWWPDFLKMAHWVASDEEVRRIEVVWTMAEVEGALEFIVNGSIFKLVCRADRIDLMADGSARIVDYKTGSVPPDNQVKSGYAPQLTLQAFILSHGGFKGIARTKVSALQYVKLSGGRKRGETKTIKLSGLIHDCATKNFAGLSSLLAIYANPTQPYLPRLAGQNERTDHEYDHLSRYQEWALTSDTQ